MLNRFQSLLSAVIRVFRIRFDKSSIDSVGPFVEFIHTRSAYVAQTSLYGYLKTRMGRDYVKIFKDEKFAPSLNTAKWQVYAACLSDLTVYAVARSGRAQPDEYAEFALHCHERCVRQTFAGSIAEGMRTQTLRDFRDRCDSLIWANAGIGAGAFTKSPEALADCSPVSDEFRRLDREIVMNSVRFRWNDIRGQLEKRLDGESVWRSWRAASSPDSTNAPPDNREGPEQC